MQITSSEYCDNTECPLHPESEKDFTRMSSTYIKVELTMQDSLTVPVPCLICEHMKQINMPHIMNKLITKDMLTR